MADRRRPPVPATLARCQPPLRAILPAAQPHRRDVGHPFEATVISQAAPVPTAASLPPLPPRQHQHQHRRRHPPVTATVVAAPATASSSRPPPPPPPPPPTKTEMDDSLFGVPLDELSHAPFTAAAAMASPPAAAVWAGASDPLAPTPVAYSPSGAGATKAATPGRYRMSLDSAHSSYTPQAGFYQPRHTPGVVMASPGTVAALAASASMYDAAGPRGAGEAAAGPGAPPSRAGTVYTFRRHQSTSHSVHSGEAGSPGSPGQGVQVTRRVRTEETTSFHFSGEGVQWLGQPPSPSPLAVASASAAAAPPLKLQRQLRAAPPQPQPQPQQPNHRHAAVPRSRLARSVARPGDLPLSLSAPPLRPPPVARRAARPVEGRPHSAGSRPSPASSSADSVTSASASRARLQCTVCGREVIGVRGLTRHMRIHTGDKPFPCTTCGRRFRQKGTLTSHMRIHSGERPYNCELCGRAFRHHGSMKRHMRGCGAAGSTAGSATSGEGRHAAPS